MVKPFVGTAIRIRSTEIMEVSEKMVEKTLKKVTIGKDKQKQG